jgi:DNA-binding LytR/AlgR family response regulator
MNILIIEDEYPAAERLERMILKIAPSASILEKLDSVEASLLWLQSQPSPDLIFSDIQLSDGLSFQIFEAISPKAPIIFTTSYDEYAIKAFKVKSIDYLLKPIKASELQSAIEKYQELKNSFIKNSTSQHDFSLRLEALMDNLQQKPQQNAYKSRFLVKQQEELIPVSIAEIAYFFTTNELVCLVKKDGRQFLIEHTLEQLEILLHPSKFFRLNRQYIASVESIRKIHHYFNGKLKIDLQPESTAEVLISREKASVFKDWLEDAK